MITHIDLTYKNIELRTLFSLQEKKWSVVFRLSAGTGLEVLNIWSSPFPMNIDLMTPILQPPDGDDTFLSSIVPSRWGIVQQVHV